MATPVTVPKRYWQLQGNDEGVQLALKHKLKVDGRWLDPTAKWLAVPISFNENVRTTEHNLTFEDLQVSNASLRLMWWYPSIKEDLNYIPGNDNPNYDYSVSIDISTAEKGIQLDAKTGTDGPPYHMWWEGFFRGEKIVSETVHLGTVETHVTLDVVWAIIPNPDYVGSGGQSSTPVTPIPAPTTPSTAKEKLFQADQLIREVYGMI